MASTRSETSKVRHSTPLTFSSFFPLHSLHFQIRKLKTLENYKFYLAFENLGVGDYVSEKVYEGLIAGTLPIYRGAESIMKFMPSKNSIINANQMTPKEIAELVVRLSNDEEEYNKYFTYRKEKLSDEFLEITQRSYCHPNVLCRLCDYAVEHKSKLANNKQQQQQRHLRVQNTTNE